MLSFACYQRGVITLIRLIITKVKDFEILFEAVIFFVEEGRYLIHQTKDSGWTPIVRTG